MQATDVYTEEEVEYELVRITDIVKGTLEKISSLEEGPRISLWQTPFYKIKVVFLFPYSCFSYMKSLHEYLVICTNAV